MLIIGAGGFAAQIIDDLELTFGNNLCFWSQTISKYDFISHYPLLTNDVEVKKYFKENSEYILAVGTPKIRETLFLKFSTLGGKNISFISPAAKVSRYAEMEKGVIVSSDAVIEAGTFIKVGCLINKKALVTHGCKIGPFCEIGPGAILNGDCIIGEKCFIGAGAIVIPKKNIGNDVVIAAGAVVINDIPDSMMVAGIPAIKKDKK